MKPVRAVLYTTVGCHLCETALAQLQTLAASGLPLETQTIDIADGAGGTDGAGGATGADADALIAKYGVRIPVVTTEARPGDLGWPFTQEQLREFLFP